MTFDQAGMTFKLIFCYEHEIGLSKGLPCQNTTSGIGRIGILGGEWEAVAVVLSAVLLAGKGS